MHRPQDPRSTVALLALAFLALVAFHAISGCAAVKAAAPLLLAGVERVLVEELEAANDARRERELRDALVLIDGCRAAHAAAEDAARRATEAAVIAHQEAERAAREREAAERARGEVLKVELRRKLARLRIRPPSNAPLEDGGPARTDHKASPE